MGIPHDLFEEKLEALKVAKGLRNDTQLNVKDLEDLVAEYKNVYVMTKGEQFPSGYFLLQGEDVVSGIRTPQELDAMKECMPEPYAELVENCKILERHYKEMMVETLNSLFKKTDFGCFSAERVVVVGDKVLCEGDWLSLNGSTGEVILGKLPLSQPALSADLGTFMSWVDEVKQLKVMVNADTPSDALAGRKNGAEGIGLCRTEHMDGLPVTIRLLDPPLHEFLPEGNIEDVVRMLSCHTNSSHEEILARVEKLSEVNPMLGFRGCRLGISYPELTAMQARAIFEAAIAVNDLGFQVFPEIMVPLVGTPQELGQQVSVIRQVADKVFANAETTIRYRIGSMIEVPRAALIADEIAEMAEFFSFGTNDLTQMTFGYSRDDIGKFLPIYISQGILQNDPFEVSFAP
ncbi:unnamed protein product [Urochloa decumbens]|uniref:PEP-utilising enzyme C-terminal domain-containing protein n=1 Tax=Urochloa decumbens TaxID=240449 RepID=A0ABC8XWE6_9POAL